MQTTFLSLAYTEKHVQNHTIFQDTYKNFDFTYYYTDEKFVRFTHSNKSQYKVEFSDELKREIETAYTNFKKRFENLEQNNIESDSMLPSIYGFKK